MLARPPGLLHRTGDSPFTVGNDQGMRRSTQACVELLAAVPIGKRAAPQHEQIGKGDGDVPLGILLR